MLSDHHSQSQRIPSQKEPKNTIMEPFQSQNQYNKSDHAENSSKNSNNPKIQVQLELRNPQHNNLVQELKQKIQGSLHQNNPGKQSNSSHRTISYRGDIDGIRAIAILLVLIYHGYPDKLPGGFIGVDVFFVISGFLITQIIVKQILKQKFSILNFYCRRIKRIYPALILVLCAVLYIVSMFTQINLATFTLNTLDSALIFCANLSILFHKKDYFDASIRGNPLLHLWSLGVQEQFYIIWPFLLILIFKTCQKNAMKILSTFTIFSFILSIVCVYLNPKFAFYFPLCRFWQMSVGGILGYADFKFRSKKINNCLSTFGLLAIVITPFLIDDESLFPGFWSLLPTLGCAAIIQAKNQALISKHILSSKPFQYIGKISYSLYLWHWPLMVGSRILYPHGSKSIFSNIHFIVGLSFAMSIITYFVAERPIRKMKNKKVVIVLLILMGGVGLASINLGDKFKEKFFSFEGTELFQFFDKVNKELAPEEQDYVTVNEKSVPNFSVNKKRQLPTSINQIRAHVIQHDWQETHPGMVLMQKSAHNSAQYADMYATLGNGWLYEFAVANEGRDNHVLLIGDSHMERISYRFQELFKRSQAQGTLDSFPTVMAIIKRGAVFGQQNPIMSFTRALVQKKKPKRILLAWNWIYHFCKNLLSPIDTPMKCDQQSTKTHISQFINFIHQLQSQGIEVFTIGVQINYVQYQPGNMFDANGIIEENLKPFKYSDFRKKYQFIYNYIEGALTKANIKWVDTAATHLCWDDLCQVISPKGYTAFVDLDHIGKYFATNWFTIYDHLVQF